MKKIVAVLTCVLLAALLLCGCQSTKPAEPLPKSSPIEEIRWGMSRGEFAEAIGQTEQQLLDTSKQRISLPASTFPSLKDEMIYGLPLAYQNGGTGELYDLRFQFAEDGSVVFLQVVVAAKDKGAMDERLTKLFGEPAASTHMLTNEKQWNLPAEGDTVPYITYMDGGAGEGDLHYFHLFMGI